MRYVVKLIAVATLAIVLGSACSSVPKRKTLTAEEIALREKGQKIFIPAKEKYLKSEDDALRTKALEKVLIAAKMNCPDAMYFYGSHYYLKRDPTIAEEKLAVQWITAAAEEDYAPAICSLATMYMRGYVLPQSYHKALSLFKRAAAFGDSVAMYNLGIVYVRGAGVIQDYHKAASWFKKAVNAGETRSRTYLGKLYLFGRGVFQNVSTAKKHFLVAAEHGDGEAMLLIGALYKNGTACKVDLVKARQWFQKAMDAGYLPAKERLDAMNASK